MLLLTLGGALLQRVLLSLLLAGNTRHAFALVLSDSAPSWAQLKERTLTTRTGQRLHHETEQRRLGRGPPHTDALLRLFNDDDVSMNTNKRDDVRITFYRDAAAWCPYCQKVWLLLEERRIPYAVQKVPLNAYGDKPAWFTRMVDGGKLPALSLDGELYVESLRIMQLLETTFSDNPIKFDDAADLMELEKEIQRAWFSLVFYPVQNEALALAQRTFLDFLQQMDDALAATPGPWFLGGETPSLIDIHYIPTLERLISSSLYYKGIQVKGRYQHLDRWLESWEEFPHYRASKCDDYTHTMAMPSQNGPGYMIDQARVHADRICGLKGAWDLPLHVEENGDDSRDDEEARHEAAFQLVSNAKAVVRFACRGAVEPGRPSFHAELADPYAEPNEDFVQPVDVCLRHVTVALLDGTDKACASAAKDLSGNAGDGTLRLNWSAYEDEDGGIYYWNEETGDTTWTPPTQQLDTCLAYVRDRIGVPRDMGPKAAMQLRAHLNWAMALM